ncbi:hypothetical protein AMJ39_07530 [candidate division TA06 bacterium DG_24]|uniref:UvrABC system protein C n=2 Tax=Bacteria division TA06 TaxID=1156500 RepID=A0A0S8JN27_UNCT6|nr:MAG: hypothetical protein AMJ39_07530 [candidate division TA06 bacterium DG_24]KPL10123.1 MAG: hypothetical protein AMJ71_04330 [candidate division TA06 bacterium SM1_40]
MGSHSSKLEEKLAHVPDAPGVYVLKDRRSRPIYIGKAKSLKDRLRTYFGAVAPDRHLQALISKIADFEYILTESDVEALILEANLIKLHLPRYNVKLKDDKKYPFVKVTVCDDFPRAFATRTLTDDGSLFFGPYTNAKVTRRALRTVNRIFGLRTCRGRLPDRACLEFHIERCHAPCEEKISKEEYRTLVERACRFLAGRSEEIEGELEEQMSAASDRQDYEQAARLRDQLYAVREVTRRQRVVFDDGKDRDVLAVARSGDIAVIVVFRVREGRLCGKEHFVLSVGANVADAEVIAAFIAQYYLGASFVPEEVIVPTELEDRCALESWLAQKRAKLRAASGSSWPGRRPWPAAGVTGRREGEGQVPGEEPRVGEEILHLAGARSGRRASRLTRGEDQGPSGDDEAGASDQVSIVVARRGDRRKLLATATRNARTLLDEECRVSEERAPPSITDLAKHLALPAPPHRIEGIDISTIQGKDAVGSVVVFIDGRPARQEYRHFKIRSVEGQNDVAMIGEVVGRRIRRLSEEEQPLPDLILVDGGVGQARRALAELQAAGVEEQVAVLGLAKRFDTVYRPDGLVIMIPKESAGLRLLQRLRDEAHRSAVRYHHRLRKRATKRSALDGIPGVGEARKRALLRRFRSVQRIRAASVEEICCVRGIGPALAERIVRFLRSE